MNREGIPGTLPTHAQVLDPDTSEIPNGHPRQTLEVVDVTCSPLQRMLHEVLYSPLLPQRNVREWRRLHRAFFSFFSSEGEADEHERKAWDIALRAFNRNLTASRNGITQVVPMTFQDCLDAVDSFQFDGLKENARRDVAWQPKKILLLMAAMIARIVAGWQADRAWREAKRLLSPFRDFLIEHNRASDYLAYVFPYDRRFSIWSYQASGLWPMLRSFPDCANALIENGLIQSESMRSALAPDLVVLEFEFRRALREPHSLRTVNKLEVAIPNRVDPPDLGPIPTEILTFGSRAPAERQWQVTERLYELALAGELVACSSQRANASTAPRISQFLGRTQAEQFAIERFFALGFQSGSGLEPWLDRVREPVDLKPADATNARERLFNWKGTFFFFMKAHHPEGASLPGARLRQDALCPKGATLFLSLLDMSVYRLLMEIPLAVDSEGHWVLGEGMLHAFGKGINGPIGSTLLNCRGFVEGCADSLPGSELKATFELECTMGIICCLLAARDPKVSPENLTRIEAYARGKIEALHHLNLPESAGRSWNPHHRDLGESRRRMETAEQAVLTILKEPLGQLVSGPLRQTLASWLQERDEAARQQIPAIHAQRAPEFKQSVAELRDQVESAYLGKSGTAGTGPKSPLALAAESRLLAEEGQTVEAIKFAVAAYQTLSKTRRLALGPFFSGLASSALDLIERELRAHRRATALSIVSQARVLVVDTPALGEFDRCLGELLNGKAAQAHAGGLSRLTDSSEAGRRRDQARALLDQFRDELLVDENRLAKEFLQAVAGGSDVAFKNKTRLLGRLRRLTQWGGREPFKTTAKLLESVLDLNNP